jgi:NAD(P)-dependent dehydrogenase (short-subunit alcohol dehydrogenase family)
MGSLGLSARMELSRLNPVTLITGAASGIGSACARTLARQSQGGLILVDSDETKLDALADALRTPPERVSMLALDVGDEGRWTQAIDFIKSQYGRLDWVIANAGAAGGAASDLVSFGGGSDLEAAALTVRSVIRLMRLNAQGGAVIVTGAVPGECAALAELARAAGEVARPDNVRVNAIAVGGGGEARRLGAPVFQDLVGEAGDERGALELVAQMQEPLVRYAETEDIAEIITMLLSDESSLSGATFVIDGGYAS